MRQFSAKLKSIRSILVLAFVLSLLIPVAAMALYGHLFTSRVLTDQALQGTQYDVHLQAHQFENDFERINHDIFYLAQIRTFRHFLGLLSRPTDEQELALWREETEQDFLLFVATSPMYRRVSYLDANRVEHIMVENDGHEARAITPAQWGQSEETYFDEVMALPEDQLYLSSFYLETEEANAGEVALMRVALRLPDNAGILEMEIYVSWLLRHLPGISAGDIWAVIDGSGHHLIYPVATNDQGGFDLAIERADSAIRDQVADFLSQPSGVIETGRSVYIFNRIEGTNSSSGDWVIYQEVPRSVLLAAVDDFYLKSLFIIGVAILTALGLALFIAGEIVNPLLDLQRKATAFAQGQELPPPPDDLPLYELGSLTLTFHEMAGELEKQRRMKHALIRRLIHAQEEERKLIAYDLHDGLIQQLVGARLYVSMIRDRAESEAPSEQLMQQLDQGCQALTEAITEGRRIIEGLHPTVLDDLGLEEAIADIAHKTAQIHGWNISLKLEKLATPPDKTVSVTVFRIVQEAINNIAKHAHAENVRISLQNSGMLKVCVEDDGSGFEVDGRGATTKSGLGVTTMRERASLIDGNCQIESTPGAGTRIWIQVPYEHEPALPNGRNHPRG